MKSIEEEIKVKQFANLQVKSELNIVYTAGYITARSMRYFKQFGISMQQYNVLRILRGKHPDSANLNDITSRMLDKMSNATRLVEKLRQKGYATREINPKSKREVVIKITNAGLKLLHQIDRDIEVVIKERYKMLSDVEMKTLNSILDKIRTKM